MYWTVILQYVVFGIRARSARISIFLFTYSEYSQEYFSNVCYDRVRTQVPKLRIAESRTLERCTSRTLRGCVMEIEAEPKMIMISKRRGRRYYTILLTNQNEKILRLYFETTQIRNRWASNIAEAIDPGVSGFLRVQQIPGAHDTDSAQWKSRYFELRKSHEAIYLFRSREDKVEAKCLYVTLISLLSSINSTYSQTNKQITGWLRGSTCYRV